MSIQSINGQISSVDRDINNLQGQVNALETKIISKSKEANGYRDRINREKDLKRIVNLTDDLHRKQEEIQRMEKEKISKEKSLNDKKKKRGELQQQLLKEEKSERDKAKKENTEILKLQERISGEIQRQSFYPKPTINMPVYFEEEHSSKIHDLFISYASEDREEVAQPLKEKLEEMGLDIWYDEAQIRVGHSIRRSIDHGLANSRYGLVILSKIYMTKYWTVQEINGLFAKNKNDSILPVWHRITRDEIINFSPMLADIKGLNTANFSIDQIAKEIYDVVKPSASALEGFDRELDIDDSSGKPRC